MKEHQNCHVEPVEKPVDREALSTATVAYLAVLGMGCDRCATRVRNGQQEERRVLRAGDF